MNIGAIALDAFMVLVIAAGLVLLAAMIREQLPHRRGAHVRGRAPGFDRTGATAQVRMSHRRAA